MATRAPKPSQRSGGGTGRKPPARRPATPPSRPRPSTRQTPPRQQTSEGAVAMLFTWLRRALLLVWRLLAHTVGFRGRTVRRGGPDLAPGLARDRTGVVRHATGLLLAAAVWGASEGPLLAGPRTVVVGAVGAFSPVIPLLCLPFAWRLMRTPGTRPTDSGRIAIGSAALLTGLLGLIHIGHGTPWPSAGMEKIHKAGGLVGFAASGPLSLLITPWLTGALLFLL